ncbi:hypothetical protein [Sphingomicrobium sediminis]|uniref:Uncharacterized protein n=1 Tax=Sphingomicrobium sediminis TaxID=2950949 RepID=A0A9X2EG45_9SPHN|nr:hypothetical protein [Sphingomicrobium sediminis]MCM8557385.1 hypothetical protein [Sphingomicrobium sediminis]
MISFKESERTKAAREKIGMASKDTTAWGFNTHPRKILALSIYALSAYSVGALLRLFSPVDWLAILGLLLIASAAFATVPIWSSRVYKIASNEKIKLDEFELQMRLRSITSAYQGVAVVVVLFMGYLMIANDVGLWLPNVADHLNGFFWGFMLYVLILPVLILSWKLRDIEAE